MSPRQARVSIVLIAIVLFLDGTRPIFGWLPAWLIFDVFTEKSDPFFSRVTTAYVYWEAELAKLSRVSLREVRVWIVVSHLLAVISIWSAWLLVRFRQSARIAIITAAVAHFLVYLAGWLSASVQSREVTHDLDRLIDLVIWGVLIMFVNSRAIRDALRPT